MNLSLMPDTVPEESFSMAAIGINPVSWLLFTVLPEPETLVGEPVLKEEEWIQAN
jgi:hypothetical protein